MGRLTTSSLPMKCGPSSSSFWPGPLDRRKDEDPNDRGPERRQERAARAGRRWTEPGWMTTVIARRSGACPAGTACEMTCAVLSQVSHGGSNGRSKNQENAGNAAQRALVRARRSARLRPPLARDADGLCAGGVEGPPGHRDPQHLVGRAALPHAFQEPRSSCRLCRCRNRC